MNLDQLCQDAQKRLAQHISRSVGQHKRAMRKQYPTTQPTTPDLKVWFVGPEPEQHNEKTS